MCEEEREQKTMANKPAHPDPEETHTDLLATLAASRELGPEMDKALAQSYIERHPELVGKQPPPAVVAQPERRAISPDIIGIAGMGIGVVAYIAVLAATQGHAWFMFWPLMGWFGWRWNRWGHSGDRDQIRQARYEARVARYRARAARWGYYDGYPQAQEPTPQQLQPQVSEPVPAQPLPPAPMATTAQAPAQDAPNSVPPVNPAG